MDTQPESPIISYDSASTQPSSPEPSGRALRVPKKLLIIGAIVFLIVLGSIVLLHSKSAKQAAQSQDILLATVGDQKIYKSDVKKAAEGQYLSPAITNDVLKNYLNVLIERKLMDIEAKKMGISITQEEIKQKITSLQPSVTQPSQSLITSTRYLLLRDKILAKNVKNIQAYSIGFWITSFDYPQKPEYAVQRTEGDKALTEIETMLKKGDAPLQVTQYIYTKYPVLQPILALNGYVFQSVTNKDVFTKPGTYVLQEKDNGKTNYDPDNFAVLSVIKPGEVKRITRKDGSGGTVIQCIDATTTGFSSYKDFINERSKQLVTINNSL